MRLLSANSAKTSPVGFQDGTKHAGCVPEAGQRYLGIPSELRAALADNSQTRANYFLAIFALHSPIPRGYDSTHKWNDGRGHVRYSRSKM